MAQKLFKNEKLPVEYPILTALIIYTKRLGIFLAVILLNFLLLGLILIFKHNPWLTVGILLIGFAMLSRFFHKESINDFAYNIYGNIVGHNEWSGIDYNSNDEYKEDNGFYQKQDHLHEDNDP